MDNNETCISCNNCSKKFNLMNLFFKKIKTTPSHISYKIFGITFRVLKKEIRRERRKIAEFYQSFDNACSIPPAEGNLRLIQLANLGFLKEFENFCNCNGLKYWIDFGTLLGCIRHKGFIPWDDDIDIAMPRDDYENLIKLLSNDNNENFFMYFEHNKKNKCFVKIQHKTSDNLFIDIFPYDFYTKKLNNDEKAFLSKQIHKNQKKNIFRTFKNTDSIREYFKIKTKQNLLKNENVDLTKEPALFMGLDFPHTHENLVFDWEQIFPLKKLRFEETELYVPNKPESVLETIFGKNYMSIPKDSYPRHSNYSELSDSEINLLENYAKNTR